MPASFELRRTAETYCGACHMPKGDWSAVIPPALYQDEAALRAHLLAAGDSEMPPSPWHRRQLAEILRGGV